MKIKPQLLFIVSILFLLLPVAKADNTEESNANVIAIQKYFGAVEAKIRSHWKPPNEKDSKLTGLFIAIFPSGQVKQVKIMQSSNDPATDASAIAAVSAAQPFPPISIPPYDSKGLSFLMKFERKVHKGHDPKVKPTEKLLKEANRYSSEGDWQKAVSILKEGLGKEPDNKAFRKRLTSIYLSEIGILHNQDPQSQQALELKNEVIKLNSDNPKTKQYIEQLYFPSTKQQQQPPNQTTVQPPNQPASQSEPF